MSGLAWLFFAMKNPQTIAKRQYFEDLKTGRDRTESSFSSIEKDY
ncbi:hypothetical protein [Microcoleus anatoxicus]|uniref:Uncharacterized protein n=1 Tax=Microcoleus anatoxicus PTRS2 TaxID=2705321 RepID=A0ABU8YJL4_9CYAN